jgi:hypothetical protein
MLSGTPIRVNVVLLPKHLGVHTINEEDIIVKDANDALKAKCFKDLKIVSYEEYQMLKVKCWR